ncbi:RodZ domain-containing protein [Pseudoalteromonas sp. T1lg65]|uniref:RodZ domain-containing protein n=1 Tax=Pseudoalteromonas sp. T1lg65 TaxID=2077101 RepID=UPI003F7AC57A
MSQTNEQQQTEQVQPSLGQTLATARQTKGVSFEEIESRLKLTHGQIMRLEQDDYLSLGPETFVKGYIRNYSLLLGLNPEDVLALYQTPEVPTQKRRMQSFSRRTHKEAHDSRLMLVSYIIAAVVLGSSAFWFWQTNNTPVAAQPDVQDSQPEPQETAAPTQVNPVIIDAPTNQASASESAAGPEAEEYQNDSINMETATEQVVVQSPPQTKKGESQIVMHFRDDSWVEIFDATEDRIAFGVKKSGYTMTVTGKPPFSVVLGNPLVVDVELDGNTVSLSGLPKNRIAKFNLPLTE